MNIEIIVTDEKLVPHYKTLGSGACDLVANIERPITIAPNSQVTIGTGLKVHIKNPKFGGFMIPRSGKGSKGLVLGNLVGLIDSDFQGEIKIPLWNRSSAPITVEPFEPVVQFAILPLIQAKFQMVEKFGMKTKRGEGGFGHTDKKGEK